MKKYLYIILVCFLIACSEENDSTNTSESPSSIDGAGGSLATFALKGDYLYVVDENSLNVFSVLDPRNPTEINSIPIGFNIETLFSYKDFLYIGSQQGMFIYSLSNPEIPTQLSSVSHFTACDPVIANDTVAYVTLHSNRFCGNNINVLELYDIKDQTAPILISRRNMAAPKGIGLFENYLLVCDNEIKIFDVSNPNSISLVNSIDKTAFDVIIQGNLLIAIGNNGLYQYNLKKEINTVSFRELSQIDI